MCVLLTEEAVYQNQYVKGTRTEESPFSGNISQQSPCGETVRQIFQNVPKYLQSLYGNASGIESFPGCPP